MSEHPFNETVASVTVARQIEGLHIMLREARSDIVDAFLLGASEFRLSMTTRLPTEEEREAYDLGRDWAHTTTERNFEE